MKTLTFLSLLFVFTSCASEKPKFVKENVCSAQALKYLKNPRNRDKRAPTNPKLIQAMAQTTNRMQSCYEAFKERSGHEEFNTCLVVGVDRRGRLEFYNFETQQIKLDQKFMACAQAVTKSVPYPRFGKNFILIQSYQFYVGE